MNRYSRLVNKLALTSNQMEKMYRVAWENGYYEKLLPLYEAPAIGRKFKFLGKLYEELVEKNQHRLLPLPEFPDTDKFEDVVRRIENKTDGLMKRFGRLTRNYGVTFLNNMFFLRSIYTVESVNVDLLLSLDHSSAIHPVTGSLLNQMTLLQNIYPLKRYFQLITELNIETDFVDTFHMLEEYKELTPELLIEQLPKKPKSFKEVHDAISKITRKIRKMNRLLEQDILFLDGQMLFEYTIEVPVDSHALIETSHDLNHCVHSYDQRVIAKQCQIINLLIKGCRVYTIELRPDGSNYAVQQFKGKYNDDSMETQEKKHYHRELYRLISENKKP